ncbi:hypothetical protein ES708_01555 [subsurface metagenome]
MPAVGSMSPSDMRDALLSLPPGERVFVITNPDEGEHKIIAIRRNSGEQVDYDYEDEPEK